MLCEHLMVFYSLCRLDRHPMTPTLAPNASSRVWGKDCSPLPNGLTPKFLSCESFIPLLPLCYRNKPSDPDPSRVFPIRQVFLVLALGGSCQIGLTQLRKPQIIHYPFFRLQP